MLNELEPTDHARTHVSQMSEPRFAAQRVVVDALFAIRCEVKRAGIHLHPFGTFRDIRMPSCIWNKKYRGEKPLYDSHGVPMPFEELSFDKRLWAILNWSALPGGSRPHWETEIDVIDLSPVPSNYDVRLLPLEVEAGGVFAPLHQGLGASHAGGDRTKCVPSTR